MRPFALVSILIALTGCFKPQTTTDDSGGGSSDGGITIFDLQQGNVEEGTVVTLTDVIITSSLTADGEGFYISEPEGGEYSGIYVYSYGSFASFNYLVGDKITVSGEYSEYYDLSELSIGGETAIEITGTGSVEPTALSSAPSDWEPYEGVLVELADQTVTSGLDNYGEVELSIGVDMDDQLFDFCAVVDQQFSSITGLVTYSYEEWKIEPRDADDLPGHDEGACQGTGGVYDVQTGAISEGMQATLEGVIVTTEMTDAGFWIQDAGGGDYSGVYVYLGSTTASVARGDVINLVGQVSEYYDLTEISVTDGADIEVVGSATPTATSIGATPGDWEVYEGVLLTLEDVAITASADSYGEAATNYGIDLDDLFYRHNAQSGDTFDSVTGVVTYSYEEWKLLPRDADDFVGGTTGGGGGDASTVHDVQTGAVSEGTTVTLEGVVATSSVTNNGAGFFVQDAGGGAYTGIYVYLGSVDLEVEAGDVLDITGEYSEYYDLSEISVASASDVTVSGTATPVADELSSTPSDWEPWEGGLVTMIGVGVTSDTDSYGQCETDWGVYLDDSFYSHGALSGDAFSAVTGLLTYSYSEWKVNPRSADDLVE